MEFVYAVFATKEDLSCMIAISTSTVLLHRIPVPPGTSSGKLNTELNEENFHEYKLHLEKYHSEKCPPPLKLQEFVMRSFQMKAFCHA